MHWVTGQTFEILAIGNGEFMYRVFLALSMLWSSGVFASLGGLGLLIGLIGLGPQTIAAGGQRMDIGSLFLGFILWLLFFAGGATVNVQEVGYNRPNSTVPGAWVVDNVPFGIAATGWLVSNVGKVVTEKMEMAYGLVDEEQSVLKTGHGRALEWLAAIRLSADPNIGGNDTRFPSMRTNLISYMRDCSTQLLLRDKPRVPGMTHSPDPLDETKGFGFLSPRFTIETWYLWPSGTQTGITCTAALEQLRAYFQDSSGQAFTDFASNVARPMGFYSGNTPGQQAISAAASLNLSVDAAQKYMLASMMTGLWHEALMTAPALSHHHVANKIMMQQAVEQKASQSAGEESMFKRTMYPLMTFLESAFYITAPFMALVIGMGRIGIGMASKFVMIPLWLAMWLPTLAVINMFQIISFRSVMDGLVANSLNAGSPYQIGSIASAAHIESSALDWMATGSMLAAATPMISLMFLMGGAYTATALAGAFKGSDVINEKIPSPDVSSSSPAISHGALRNYSVGSGQTVTGASLPSLSFGRGLSENESRASSALERATRQYGDVSDNTVTEQMMSQRTAGVRGDAQSQQRVEAAESRSRSIAQSVGLDASKMDSQSYRNAIDKAVAWETQFTGGIGIGKFGASMTAKHALSNHLQESSGMDSQLADKFAAAYVDRGEFRAAATATHAESLSEFASIQGTDSATAASARKMSDAAMDMSQKMEQWSITKSATAQQGASQSFDAGQVGTAFMAAGAEASVALFNDALASGVSYDKFDNIKQGLNMDGIAIPGAITAGGAQLTTKDMAAMALAANEHAPGVLASHAANSGVLNILGMSDHSRPERGSLANDVESGAARSAVQGVGDLGPSEGAEARAHSGMAMWTEQGRAAATGTLVSETGLGRNAQAAGDRAKPFLNPDGSLNQPVFEAASAGMKEKARGVLSAANENQRAQMSDEFNAMYANTPLGQGWMRRLTNDDQGGARLGGVVEMAKGNHIENTRVAGYEAAIRDGSMFGGHAIAGGVGNNGDAAKVLAYYAATVGQNGQALSERQVADMQATYAALTPIEQFAVREQIAKWDSDSPRPSEVVPLLAQVARAAPDPDKIGVAPAQVPSNSLREYDSSGGFTEQTYHGGLDGHATVPVPVYSEQRQQQERERNIREGTNWPVYEQGNQFDFHR